ncbi:hypothetical protein BT96DRAFT_912963 [Gymnopus androsaceus JB14]|uniref:Uncharacterized protein n=1 Tax=Gymnopus androsaceus JB14 TaxID=1447944 RepID=A0A6A4IKL3_9AGAR|nr:hypothetical protein BT96DRAFT_912963 [Gymnopus androsaceus JB14]
MSIANSTDTSPRSSYDDKTAIPQSSRNSRYLVRCECPNDKLPAHCQHFDSHYLVRCGCPNDKPPSDPMHFLDDAYHKVWCSSCLCYIRVAARRPGARSAHILELIARVLRPLRGCV